MAMRFRANAVSATILLAVIGRPSIGQEPPIPQIRPPSDVRPSGFDASNPASAAPSTSTPRPAPVPFGPSPFRMPVEESFDDPTLPEPFARRSMEIRPPIDSNRLPAPPMVGGDGPLMLTPVIQPAIRGGLGASEDRGPSPFPAPGAGDPTRRERRDDADEGRQSAVGGGRSPRGLFGLLSRVGVRSRDVREVDRPIERPAIDPDDPNAVESLRRGIERHLDERMGDRLSTLEVLIVGPRVHIRARAAHFWQRRALRRDLESLPMPEGFRSTVDVL